eukprot:1184886-Prorocentrum_minimum.AAC.2
MGSPSRVAVPWHSTYDTASGTAPACFSARTTASRCPFTLGALNDTLALPSLFMPNPATTASTVSPPWAGGAESSRRSTVPVPSPNIVPEASASKVAEGAREEQGGGAGKGAVRLAEGEGSARHRHTRQRGGAASLHAHAGSAQVEEVAHAVRGVVLAKRSDAYQGYQGYGLREIVNSPPAVCAGDRTGEQVGVVGGHGDAAVVAGPQGRLRGEVSGRLHRLPGPHQQVSVLRVGEGRLHVAHAEERSVEKVRVLQHRRRRHVVRRAAHLLQPTKSQAY